MPLSGLVLSAAAGNTTQYFFLFPIPPFLEKNKGRGSIRSRRASRRTIRCQAVASRCSDTRA
jgi:cytochrome b561